MSRSTGRVPCGPRYPGLEFCAVLLNVMGGVAALGGLVLIVLGLVKILDKQPGAGLTIVVSGGSIVSAGLIQVGLASGLTCLRDIARNTYAGAHSIR